MGVITVLNDCPQIDRVFDMFLYAENEQEIVAALTEMSKQNPSLCPVPVIEKLLRCLTCDTKDIVDMSLSVLTMNFDYCNADWTCLLTDTAVFVDLIHSGNPGVVAFLLKLAPSYSSFLSKVFSRVTIDEVFEICQSNPNLASLIEILSFCSLQRNLVIEVITKSFKTNPLFLPAGFRALARFLEDKSLIPDLLQMNIDSVIRDLVFRSQSFSEEALCDLLHICLIFWHNRIECVTLPVSLDIFRKNSPRVSGMALMLMSEMIETDPERFMPQFRECEIIPILCACIKESSADERRKAAYTLAILMKNATSNDFRVMLENITFVDLFEIFELDDICTTIFVMNIVSLSFRFIDVGSIPLETVHHVLDVLEAMSENPDPDVAGFAAALALDIDEAFDQRSSESL